MYSTAAGNRKIANNRLDHSSAQSALPSTLPHTPLDTDARLQRPPPLPTHQAKAEPAPNRSTGESSRGIPEMDDHGTRWNASDVWLAGASEDGFRVGEEAAVGLENASREAGKEVEETEFSKRSQGYQCAFANRTEWRFDLRFDVNSAAREPLQASLVESILARATTLRQFAVFGGCLPLDVYWSVFESNLGRQYFPSLISRDSLTFFGCRISTFRSCLSTRRRCAPR